MPIRPGHKYDDIIHLPRPVSSGRPRMSAHDRAAQFSPFSALTGYDAAIEETARQTRSRIILDENEKELLNEKLRQISRMAAEHPTVKLCYFRPDMRKAGGDYPEIIGRVIKLCPDSAALLLENGLCLAFEDIIQIEILKSGEQ